MDINRTYNIDCLDGMRQLPDHSVDLVVTSPPYVERRKSTYGGIREDKYLGWFRPLPVEIFRIMKPTGSFFLNIKPHTQAGERSLYIYI